MTVQTLPLHWLLAQSLAARHARPATQRAQPPAPPQSTSVSLPSFLRLAQNAGSAQRLPAPQKPLWQSVDAAQARPLAQATQVLPPQSTSVSFPSTTPSLQVAAAAQRPDAQRPL